MLHSAKIKHVESALTAFKCHLCPIGFTRADKLKYHLQQKHEDAKPFVCTICGKAFAYHSSQKCHERTHSREKIYVCKGELSAQPARGWGCGRRFARADTLARHFFSEGKVGRACIIPLLDEEVKKAGVFTLPSVLLTQYPELKSLDLAHISTSQNASTGGDSGLSFNDSGYKGALHLNSTKPLSIPRVQVEAQTGGPQKALPYHCSLPSPENKFMLSAPLPDLQNPSEFFRTLADMSETSRDSDNSLAKTIWNGDKPDRAGFGRGMEFSGHRIDSHGTSDSEGRSSYSVRHLSKENNLAQERGSEEDSNGHLSDNSEGSHSPDESSSNSGSEHRCNDTSEGSVFDCSQRALISRLMDEICSSFFYHVNHGPRQRGQGGQGSQESSFSSTKQANTTGSFISRSSNSQRKRNHKEDEDPEDEDDAKHKRPRNQNSDDVHSTRVRCFACPFHKFDASTYGGGNADRLVGLKYRSCGPPGWPNIGKLK